MGVVGTLLKNRRAGEAKLAWNRPNLSAPETLTLTSEAFGDGEAIPAGHAGKRAGGRNLSPQLAWSADPVSPAPALLLDSHFPLPGLCRLAPARHRAWTSRRTGSSLEHASHR